MDGEQRQIKRIRSKKNGLWSRARRLKTELLALFLALKHPATPWFAKLFTAVVVGYALSPIDLIPDFIPVLGLLDDLILLPLGISLAIRMIPVPIFDECRSRAAAYLGKLPSIWLAAVVIMLVWLALGYALWKMFL